MVSIKFHLWKRQSGKTTIMVHDFLKNPNNSYIVVMDRSMRNELLKSNNALEPYKDQIITSTSLDKFRGRKVVNLYVDEYFYMMNRDELISVTEPSVFSVNGSVNIYSSLKGFTELDSFVCSLIRTAKSENKSKDFKEIIKLLPTESRKLVMEWWDDYLTYPYATFVSHPCTMKNENLGEFLNNE